MNINNFTKYIIEPKRAAAAVFIATGAYKTISDVTRAPKEKKLKVFTKDALILAGSAAGFGAMQLLVKKMPPNNYADFIIKPVAKLVKSIADTDFIKTKILPKMKFLRKPFEGSKNFVEVSLRHTERVVKDCISNVVTTLGGVAGAVAANSVVSNHIFKKEKSEIIKQKAQNSFNFVNMNKFIEKDEANQLLSNMSDLPEMKIFGSSMAAMQGFEIIKEKGMKNKIRQTSYDLIANTLLPTFFISTISIFTKNLKNYLKIPIMLVGVACGTAIGNKTTEKYKDKINQLFK